MSKDYDILRAVQLLQSPTTADAASRERAASLLLDNASLVLKQHTEGLNQEPLLRHIVKVLSAESTSMSQSKWDMILELMCSLLETPVWTPPPAGFPDSVETAPKREQPQGALPATPTTSFSWAFRAFILKCLPCMVPQTTSTTNSITDADHASASLAPMMTRQGKAVCDVLLSYSIVSQEQDDSAKQMTRVAHSSLLALPPPLLPHVAHELISRLPRSRDACLAIIQNPSATDPLLCGFEEALLEMPGTSNSAITAVEEKDSTTELSSTADLVRDSVKRTLQRHYKSCGMVSTNRLCNALIQRSLPKTQEEMESYRTQTVRPLIELGEACERREPSLQISAHLVGIQQRIPLPFLCEILGYLYRQYESAIDVFPYPDKGYETALLNLARDLAQLSLIAVSNSELPEGAVNQLAAVLMPKTQKQESPAVVTDGDVFLMERGFVDRIPLPLMECVLLLLYQVIPYRSLKRFREPNEEANSGGEEKEHNEDVCVRCARFLKKVVLPEIEDVAFRVSAVINGKDNGATKLPKESSLADTLADSQIEQGQCSNAKTTEEVSGDCDRREEQLDVMNTELRGQLTILNSIAGFCEKIWHQTQHHPRDRFARRGNALRGRLSHALPSWMLNPVVYGAPRDVNERIKKRARFNGYDSPRKMKR
ncbi:unnamed protein product [Phytomonas sp. EM1]|nr:unnamed protein product [Phytomonas sp. EM1]|eukprot:CCW60524.1 unnamed protein product [Phytomonas sp. isolate EM1]